MNQQNISVFICKEDLIGMLTSNRFKQAIRTFYKLYPLLNRHSPLRTEYYLLIYRLCIRPILTYASPVWNNASNTSIKTTNI
ncbi:hypothetical protein C0J52_25987 [Blattella germanica]|nr:hypothetical protein C0J52_25987 [Blattella germanica]